MQREIRPIRTVDGIGWTDHHRPVALVDPVRRRRQWQSVLGGLIVFVFLALWVAPLVGFIRTLAPFWRPGRYLVLLENDAELRPGGGFIGSYAVVTINGRGWPHAEFQSNIYKVDNAFTAAQAIPPPEPLQGIVDRWSLRDSNWAIDGADSAHAVANFFKLETGQSVDGVIGLTAHVGQGLVGQLGAVLLPDGTKLTAANFYSVLAYQVEKGYFLDPAQRAINEPKTVVKSLVQSVALRLALPWHVAPAVQLVRTSLATKFITVNFFDAARQQQAEQLGWTNRVDRSSQHYLAVSNANIAGLKSSQSMSQQVQLDITDSGTGSATYQLTLARTHHGDGVWPDHRNDNLTRLVLPTGAVPTAATLDGQPVSLTAEESTGGQAVVNLRIDTEPGTSRTLVTTFKVPIDRSLAPSFTWQKQPGVVSDDLTVRSNGRMVHQGLVDRDLTVNIPLNQ